MAEERFELRTRIRAPRERVFEELADPLRFLGLQPFLVSVREVAAAEGRRAFEAVERVPIAGPLRWPNRIRVELAPNPDAAVVGFDARSPGRVRLCGEFALRSVGAETELRQTVAIECPALLRSFVRSRARAAQEALHARLRSRLESEHAAPVATAAPAEPIPYPRGTAGGPQP